MSNYVNATYVLDANGSSGLHIAADAGHADVVDRLLRVRSSDNTIGTWYVPIAIHDCIATLLIAKLRL